MKDGKEDYLSPWRFTSSDGRFEMQFQPVLDRAACTDLKLLKSDQHQVFGTFYRNRRFGRRKCAFGARFLRICGESGKQVVARNGSLHLLAAAVEH